MYIIDAFISESLAAVVLATLPHDGDKANSI